MYTFTSENFSTWNYNFHYRWSRNNNWIHERFFLRTLCSNCGVIVKQLFHYRDNNNYRFFQVFVVLIFLFFKIYNKFFKNSSSNEWYISTSHFLEADQYRFWITFYISFFMLVPKWFEKSILKHFFYSCDLRAIN